MSLPVKRARILITLFVSLALTGGTVLAIKIAKGYRPNFEQMALKGTGLLSATSYPKGGQVFINSHLTTVTDDTLYLNPNEYQIKIIKSGFHTWSKTVSIKPELVSLADARLFPVIPSTTPLTFYKVSKPLVSPDGSKLLYTLTDSPFNQDNGLYVLSLANNLLLGTQITQITALNTHDYSKAELIWSPDASQILAVFYDNQKVSASHLLNPKTMNQTKDLIDTTIRLPTLLSTWQEQISTVTKNNLSRFPDFITQMATQSAANIYFSPDREKLLYTATKEITIPNNLVDHAIANTNSTPQSRGLIIGKTYVYDSKEDSNYLINEALQFSPSPTPPQKKTKAENKSPEILSLQKQIDFIKRQTDPRSTQNLSWYSTNRHLVISNSDNVSVVEYDGTNLTPLISASINNFAVTSPDGTHLIILSNMNQKSDVFNLISADLK